MSRNRARSVSRLGVYVCIAAFTLGTASAARAVLFFSEYVEGSSNNKAIEVFNNSGASVDLAAAAAQIEIYFNGSGSAGTTIGLTGIIASMGTYVVADNDANAAILAAADQTSTSNFWNGDDAIALRVGGTIVDVIGQIGADPGSEWSGGGIGTANETLRRKPAVTMGDANGGDAFDPSVEWDGFAQDTTDGLGAHTIIAGPPVPAPVLVKFANQDFNALGAAGPDTANDDQFSAGTSDNNLTNGAANYDGASPVAGAGIPFMTFWTDTRGNEGPLQGAESGDFIGVNTFTGAAAPDVDPDGSAVEGNFEFNDGDGRLDLRFAPVNRTGFTDVQLMFNYWIEDTGYESPDSLVATLADDLGNIETILSLDDLGLEALAAVDESAAASWRTLTYDLAGSSLTGSQLFLTISADTNAGSENIFIDNVMFLGQAVPEPSSLLLLTGAAGFAGLLRRRRRARAA